jgi:hypothetical protein
VRLVSATILAALVLVSASPAGAQSGPPEPHESIEATTGTASVETIGPDGLGSVPSPPIGPAWRPSLERSLHNVLEMDAVACGDGFTLLVYGSDRRYRPRALVFTSPNGVEWSRGETLRPRGDPIAGAWAVHELVEFRGDLLALGGEDRRLVVWRSRDCGQSWRRLPERPAFFLGRKAIELNAVEAVSTDDTLLVLGRQGGELNPRRDWAWTLDDEEGWRRIRGLGDAFDFGLASDGQRFLASRLAEDAAAGTDLVASLDGRRWHVEGHLPDRTTVIPDAARDRLLAQSELVGTGWLSPEIQASADAMDWSLLARAAPIPHGSSGRLYEADGALVWIIDIWDDTEANAWSWVGVSEDGGSTWTVSAGQPGMQLAGLQSVAATDDAIVLAFTGEGFDAIRAWALPR